AIDAFFFPARGAFGQPEARKATPAVFDRQRPHSFHFLEFGVVRQRPGKDFFAPFAFKRSANAKGERGDRAKQRRAGFFVGFAFDRRPEAAGGEGSGGERRFGAGRQFEDEDGSFGVA